jgi:hypothetical protein
MSASISQIDLEYFTEEYHLSKIDKYVLYKLGYTKEKFLLLFHSLPIDNSIKLIARIIREGIIPDYFFKCQKCGRVISDVRIKAHPLSRLCIDCQRNAEKHGHSKKPYVITIDGRYVPEEDVRKRF